MPKNRNFSLDGITKIPVSFDIDIVEKTLWNTKHTITLQINLGNIKNAFFPFLRGNTGTRVARHLQNMIHQFKQMQISPTSHAHFSPQFHLTVSNAIYAIYRYTYYRQYHGEHADNMMKATIQSILLPALNYTQPTLPKNENPISYNIESKQLTIIQPDLSLLIPKTQENLNKNKKRKTKSDSKTNESEIISTNNDENLPDSSKKTKIEYSPELLPLTLPQPQYSFDKENQIDQ
jgi:hypothetical protein